MDVKQELFELMKRLEVCPKGLKSLHYEDRIPVGLVETFLIEKTNWAKLVYIHKTVEELMEMLGSMEFTNRLCPVCGARFSDGCTDEDKSRTSIRILSKE